MYLCSLVWFAASHSSSQRVLSQLCLETSSGICEGDGGHFRRTDVLILGECNVVSLWQSCGGGGLLSSLPCGIVPVQRLLVVGLAVQFQRGWAVD